MACSLSVNEWWQALRPTTLRTDDHYPLYTSLCTGELNAIRKHKCFLCSPFYVKGVSLGHVGRNQNLKDLKLVAGTVVQRS